MANFIECSKPEAHYFFKSTNKAINLENVTSVRKFLYHREPDNNGRPCIEFTFIGGGVDRWIYQDYHTTSMEVDYNRIINTKSNL